MGDQSPSPLRPTRWSSSNTTPVSSRDPLAEPLSTTVSSPSDTEPSPAKNTSSSRTPGVPPGETRATLSSDPATSAVSSPSHPTHRPTELDCNKTSFQQNIAPRTIEIKFVILKI